MIRTLDMHINIITNVFYVARDKKKQKYIQK